MTKVEQAKHLIHILIQQGYDTVQYVYEGSGDSLQHEQLNALDHNMAVAGISIPAELHHTIVDFCREVVHDGHAGFENNDGGRGEIIFYLNPDRGLKPHVVVHHWDYVVTTEEFEAPEQVITPEVDPS